MYYSCQEHIELAMDHVIDEQEVPPVIEKVEGGLSTVCSFCNGTAIYVVKE
ncbi:CxxH/CxxC protein [Bacillus sp. FJAT-45350]|uniref:CxxH/CxxC protein n=1 Tax=Bacillus sp. FJAT-45350 TaxID=2011014 RepID=UPI000BB85CAB|nr:CxxH/CxxC protein [Bacillus sp. FJAT-45350]